MRCIGHSILVRSMGIHGIVISLPAITPFAPNPAAARAGVVATAGAAMRTAPVPTAIEVFGFCFT